MDEYTTGRREERNYNETEISSNNSRNYNFKGFISRRNFVRGLGLTMGLLSILSCGPSKMIYIGDDDRGGREDSSGRDTDEGTGNDTGEESKAGAAGG